MLVYVTAWIDLLSNSTLLHIPRQGVQLVALETCSILFVLIGNASTNG